jgi:hypothetical protein
MIDYFAISLFFSRDFRLALLVSGRYYLRPLTWNQGHAPLRAVLLLHSLTPPHAPKVLSQGPGTGNTRTTERVALTCSTQAPSHDVALLYACI